MTVCGTHLFWRDPYLNSITVLILTILIGQLLLPFTDRLKHFLYFLDILASFFFFFVIDIHIPYLLNLCRRSLSLFLKIILIVPHPLIVPHYTFVITVLSEEVGHTLSATKTNYTKSLL